MSTEDKKVVVEKKEEKAVDAPKVEKKEKAPKADKAAKKSKSSVRKFTLDCSAPVKDNLIDVAALV